MWTLNLPDHMDAIDNITKAFTYVNGNPKFVATPTDLRLVGTLYTSYEANFGVPNELLQGAALRPELRDALHDAYDEVQTTGRLKELRNRLFINAERCPCCGILAPDELDHYLPQVDYPALSIYSSNIVPYCHLCNKRKLANDGVNPDRRFIHVYYNELPENVQFLFAKVWIEGRGLQCELEVRSVPEIDEQVIRQMNFQVGRVKLVDRVIAEMITFLSPTATYLQQDFETGGRELVSDGLLKSAQNQQKQYGRNHWRTAVMTALAACDEFCDGGFHECLSLDRNPALLPRP